MTEPQVVTRFVQLMGTADKLGLTLSFNHQEFLLCKPDGRPWGDTPSLNDVAKAIEAYAEVTAQSSPAELATAPGMLG